MTNKYDLPFELYYQDQKVGELLTFSYETPWSTGELVFYDLQILDQLIKNRIYSDYLMELEDLELTEIEDERLASEKEKELKLTGIADEMMKGDKWSIVNCNGKKTIIYGLNFSFLGYLDWRGGI